jgi:hypothetical protein
MKQTFASVFIAFTFIQGVALDVPFTYCFTGGELCCEGYSQEVNCSSPTAPGLKSCCAGNGVLVARSMPSRSEVKAFTVQPEACGTVLPAPDLSTALRIPASSTPCLIPPHLSSVVLRI